MVRRTKDGRGGWRPGSGAKPLPPGKKRAARVHVNVTEAEHAELLRDAGELSPSDYLRALWLRSRRRRKN